jgi:hypothetical protein
MSPDQVKIRVVNGSGPNNSGAEVLDSFVAAGFKSAGPAENADRNDYQTQVRYAPGRFRQGYTVAVAVGTLDLVQATSAKNTLGGDVLLIVGRDYSRLKHRFDRLPRVAHRAPAPTTTSTIARRPTTTTSTTTTTIPRTVDTRFVPVDPQTGGPLIGCPKNS